MRTCLALFLTLSGPALADVTAAEVWAGLQRQAAAAGLLLSAEERQQGRDLVLDQPRLHLSPIGPPALRLDRLVLRETAAGSVTVLLPDQFPITLDLPPSAVPTDPRQLVFTAALPGLEIVVDDLGAKAAFRVHAPSASLTLKPGAFPAGEEASLILALADLTLTHRQDLGATHATVTTDLVLGTLHAEGVLSSRNGTGVSASLDVSAVDGRVAVDVNPAALNNPLATVGQLLSRMTEGQKITVGLGHGPVAIGLTIDDDLPGIDDLRFTAGEGQAAFRANHSGIGADLWSSGVELFLAGEDPGVPLHAFGASYDDLVLGASLDVYQPSDPADYSGVFRLEGVRLSDPVWATLDPGAVFPRDALGFSLALSGRLQEKPRSRELALGDPAPLDLLSVSFDELRAYGLGASATGAGALTFDNSDLITFDGVPAPEGALTFTATGVSTLLDRAVAAGLVPVADLTALRLGLAFIAKPGPDPETLTSRIEFRDKSLVLNGIKLR